MIILKMQGGLGNQMFQYAFGKACSVKMREPLFLDLSWYGKKNGKRRFLLGETNASFERFSKDPLYVKALRLIKRPRTVKDSGFFEERLLPAGGNLLLEGFWESYKYFEAIADGIRRELVLKKPSEKLAKLSRNVRADSIAIHVRRGDFLSLDDRCRNGIGYYSKAVEHILRKKSLKDPQITIFSDDPKWCKDELRSLAGQPTEVFEKKLDSDVEEMMLMSSYGNNVIANSTFSWWAAYLNMNPGKITVIPENWYTDPVRNERYLAGIRVPGWTVIE